MRNDIERELYLTPHAHEPMHCRRSLDFKVVAVNAELTLSSQIISGDNNCVGIVIRRVTP